MYGKIREKIHTHTKNKMKNKLKNVLLFFGSKSDIKYIKKTPLIVYTLAHYRTLVSSILTLKIQFFIIK